MHKTFGKCTQTTNWNYELVSLLASYTLSGYYVKYVSIWALGSEIGWLRHCANVQPANRNSKASRPYPSTSLNILHNYI